MVPAAQAAFCQTVPSLIGAIRPASAALEEFASKCAAIQQMSNRELEDYYCPLEWDEVGASTGDFLNFFPSLLGLLHAQRKHCLVRLPSVKFNGSTFRRHGSIDRRLLLPKIASSENWLNDTTQVFFYCAACSLIFCADVVVVQGHNWLRVAQELSTRRTAWQCFRRYQCHIKPVAKKGVRCLLLAPTLTAHCDSFGLRWKTPNSKLRWPSTAIIGNAWPPSSTPAPRHSVTTGRCCCWLFLCGCAYDRCTKLAKER